MTQIREGEQTYPIEVRRKLWDNPKHPGWPINLDKRYIPIYRPLDFPIAKEMGATLLHDRPVTLDEMEGAAPLDIMDWLVKKQPDLVMLNLQPGPPAQDSETWEKFRSSFLEKVPGYMSKAPWWARDRVSQSLHAIGSNMPHTSEAWDWDDVRRTYESALVASSIRVKTYYRPDKARLFADTDSHGGVHSLDRSLTLPVSIQLVDADQPLRLLSIPTETTNKRLQKELADAFPAATGYHPANYGETVPANEAFEWIVERLTGNIQETVSQQVGRTINPTLPGIMWNEGFVWNKAWDIENIGATPHWQSTEPQKTQIGKARENVGLFYPAKLDLYL
jgi:hypothetical protein